MQTDLKKVSAESARSIIVLADNEITPDMADVNVVRTLLSLHGINAPQNGHIVCEVSDADNDELVKICGRGKVETFVSHDVIGRLMIQCVREMGLAQVLEKLLGFEGHEFYIKSWPELTGKRFVDVINSFEEAVVVGVLSRGEDLRLNPASDYILQQYDELIVIAEDDDSYAPSATGLVFDASSIDIDSLIFTESNKKVLRSEKLAFVGWRRDIDDMIVQLDNYAAPGSELTMFSLVPLEIREQRLREGGLEVSQLNNLKINHVFGNSTSRKDLEALNLEDYDSVLVLAGEALEISKEDFNFLDADSRSLTSLLLIRDIRSKRQSPRKTRRASMTAKELDRENLCIWSEFVESKTSIISEVLDSRTKSLINIASVTDYVASNEIVSTYNLRLSFELNTNIFAAEHGHCNGCGAEKCE